MQAEDSLNVRQIISMHALFFATGMGAMLLGPLLPRLASLWHLHDQQSGTLIGAQFLGSFLGATTLRPNPRADIVLAFAAISAGFAVMAIASGGPGGFPAGVAALLIAGFGLGRAITAINIVAGMRFGRRRASGLSLLNLTWGIGAILAPLAVASAAGSRPASAVSGAFAAATLLALAGAFRSLPKNQASGPSLPGTNLSLPASALLGFALLFFLYGGLEAGVSGWFSTFAIRSTGETLKAGAATAGFLWLGLTAGRALASLLLLRFGERALLAAGMALSASACTMLAFAHTGRAVAVLAGTLGLGLAPAFPALSSLLMASRPNPRHTGIVMAISSLGGALFGWAMGAASQHGSTWHVALSLPVSLSLLLLLLPSWLISDRPIPPADVVPPTNIQ